MTDTTILIQTGESGISISNIIMWFIYVGTFIVALLAFLAQVTNWFKPSIPIDFGFLVDNKIQKNLELATGDAAKPIILRCHNNSQMTIRGLVIDIQFLKPLALSGTGTALTVPTTGTLIHGRSEDKSFYLISYSGLDLLGEGNLDFRVELNTTDQTPGTSTVQVRINSIRQDYKYKKLNLSIKMK